MFRIRSEFYTEKEYLPGSNKPIVKSILNPKLFQKELEKEGNLPENLEHLLNQTVNKTNFRNPILFSIGVHPLTHLLEDDMYTFNMHLQKPERDEYKKKISKTKIQVQKDDNNTILYSINPESSAEKKLLNKLKRNEAGELISKELAALEKRSEKASRNLSTAFIVDYDPEEIKLVSNIWSMYNAGIGNNKISQNYFLQMASLFHTGSFANVSNSQIISGIKGLSPDNSSQILSFAKKPSTYMGWNKDIPPLSPDEKENFREMLNQDVPWYVNEKFKRDLDINKILHVCNRLGSAFLKDEEDSAVNIAAIATENLVSEVYEALKDSNCNREDFVDKMKYINKNLQDSGILDPFIHVYTDKKTNPGNIRGEMVHVGSYRSNENNSAYFWAAEFYIDLAKTLLSAVGQKGNQYLEFDHYARLTNLVHEGKDSVAYVPITMKQKNNHK